MQPGELLDTLHCLGNGLEWYHACLISRTCLTQIHCNHPVLAEEYLRGPWTGPRGYGAAGVQGGGGRGRENRNGEGGRGRHRDPAAVQQQADHRRRGGCGATVLASLRAMLLPQHCVVLCQISNMPVLASGEGGQHPRQEGGAPGHQSAADWPDRAGDRAGSPSRLCLLGCDHAPLPHIPHPHTALFGNHSLASLRCRVHAGCPAMYHVCVSWGSMHSMAAWRCNASQLGGTPWSGLHMSP